MTSDGYEPDPKRWDAFIDWARRFYEWDGFAEAERDYKLELGAALAETRDAFLAGRPEWSEQLRKVMGHPWVPVFRIMIFRFMSLLESNPEIAAAALRPLWATDDSVPRRERVRGFIEGIMDAPQPIGTPEAIAAFLLLARDPTSNPFYMWSPFKTAYEMTGHPRVSVRAPSEEKYGHAVDFLDVFMSQAVDRGLDIEHRLDAQSLVWCVTQTTPDDWNPETLADLRVYRGEETPPPPPPNGGRSNGGTPPVDPPLDWLAVAEELKWEPADLEEIIIDLEDKRQMIFHGPPGTGKTFVAKRIAAEYERAGGGFEIVQFHPSYAYEDFVEGYRPTLRDGQAGFELRQGPLRRLAARAAANPRDQFVMVIDELNRGNVAKVFGELYFLLEYRDEGIRLQYGDERFSLPENLLFICTMNTADRSIALVDAALRRRFWFHGFFPDEPPIEGLLRRWLAEHQPGAEWVADLVDRANVHLGDRDAAIGPSYFMSDAAELDDERVRRIWQRAVRPYVEEQCYGEEDKLRSLEYDRLRGELAAAEQPADASEAVETGGEEAGGDDG